MLYVLYVNNECFLEKQYVKYILCKSLVFSLYDGCRDSMQINRHHHHYY